MGTKKMVNTSFVSIAGAHSPEGLHTSSCRQPQDSQLNSNRPSLHHNGLVFEQKPKSVPSMHCRLVSSTGRSEILAAFTTAKDDLDCCTYPYRYNDSPKESSITRPRMIKMVTCACFMVVFVEQLHLNLSGKVSLLGDGVYLCSNRSRNAFIISFNCLMVNCWHRSQSLLYDFLSFALQILHRCSFLGFTVVM